MMLPMARSVPETVAETSHAFIARHFGDEGRAWLASLPEALATMTRRWQLELGPPLPGGLLAAVHLVTRTDGSQAVLKVGGPWSRTRDEIAALRAWKGGPAPAVLLADEDAGAVLLERIEPGSRPSSASANEVAILLPELHIAPFDGIPTLAEVVGERLEKARREGRQTSKLAWAFAKLADLERDTPPAVLLHGDFDERNMLVCSRRGLVAIDPVPCAGDPAYDAGYWVHSNRLPGRRARLDALVSLGFDRTRVRDWAAVVGVHG
jgi:streptomycin 6-kinase